MNIPRLVFGLVLAMGTGHAYAMSDAELGATVDRRLAGDRTGACLAVAVIEAGQVARSYRCADPAQLSRIGADSAFEIGSVSKTMTAALLADMIGQGQASLDDPLSAYLPEGTKVPEFQGQPILLRHVVTHTSGLPRLPSRMGNYDPADPYARLDERALLDSLGEATLEQAPGTRFEYSNFASMLLSYALARRTGTDFESLLRQRLFAPLGMKNAYVGRKPENVRTAAGHMSSTQPTAAWNFATDLAGVGGVRATLDDMVRYAQGELGLIQAPITTALALSQQQLWQQPPMAMNWMLAPLDGCQLHVHEGATGGFSSFVGLDTQKRRGVVILSDTAWTSVGGLGELGQHLIDSRLPLGKPRKAAEAPDELLDALAGQYRVAGSSDIELGRKGNVLTLHVAGQGDQPLGYDDAGDFYPQQPDAVLRPRHKADGGYDLSWIQGGGVLPVRRIDAQADQVAAGPGAGDLDAYVGTYPLQPSFELAIRAREGRLFAQATGQSEIGLDAEAKDVFKAAAYGIEIRFQRDAAGTVSALEVHQAGQVLRGTRR